MELSPETCRVKPLRIINAIVASCWIYFIIRDNRLYEVYSELLPTFTIHFMVSYVTHLERGIPRQHTAYDTKVRNNELFLFASCVSALLLYMSASSVSACSFVSELDVLVPCFCTCRPFMLVPTFL